MIFPVKCASTPRRRILQKTWWVLWTFLAGEAGLVSANTVSVPKTFRSSHFVVQTDLDAEATSQLLESLETTLLEVVRYWKSPLKNRIRCYIVDDLKNWEDVEFPNQYARTILSHIGGATEFAPRKSKSKHAVIYATSKPGIAEHEIVHAYCSETFGRCGPDWYKEGMAELAYFLSRGRNGISVSDKVLSVLKKHPARSIRHISGKNRFTAPITTAVIRSSSKGIKGTTSLAWRPTDDQMVRNAKESYYWSWALCYFLSHHPSYEQRFYLLGQNLLAGRRISLAKSFLAVRDRLNFEFELFIKQIDQGYRVDLTAWDWDQTIRKDFASHGVTVAARRGYQAAGVRLQKGKSYHVQANGSWTTNANGIRHSADGDDQQTGQLEGAILRDFQLSEPFALGSSTDFLAPTSGRLYLRCRDKWHELEDNDGALEIVISPK